MGMVILSLIRPKENNSTNVTIKAIRIETVIDKLEIKIFKMKNELIKNAKLPSKLFLLYILVTPYFMPIIAAKESEILIVNKDAIMIDLSLNNNIIIKHPSK